MNRFVHYSEIGDSPAAKSLAGILSEPKNDWVRRKTMNLLRKYNELLNIVDAVPQGRERLIPLVVKAAKASFERNAVLPPLIRSHGANLIVAKSRKMLNRVEK